MIKASVLSVVLASASAAPAAPAALLGDAHLTFDQFALRHNRAYAPEELAMRRAAFARTKASVVERNSAYAAGKSTWFAAINDFADRTEDELRKVKGGMPRPSTADGESIMTATSVAATSSKNSPSSKNPPSMSWMEYQSPVKNQGGCGSCWAFATTEVVESHIAIARNSTEVPVLAPQTLVSCMKNPNKCGGTGGCQGAIAELGFNFTKTHGLATESAFPYTAQDTQCLKYEPAAHCKGYVKNKENSADALETALATVGPVAVTVSANWATYGGGIFSDGCSNDPPTSCTLDHAVVAVGYTADYWLIRNSWGSGWGEQGYIRLTRKHDTTQYTDSNPTDGDACAPYPEKQFPMGESGVLYDTAYPVGMSQ
jgi:cathepsin L